MNRREFFAASAAALAGVSAKPDVPEIGFGNIQSPWPEYVQDSGVIWITECRDGDVAGSPRCIDWIVVG